MRKLASAARYSPRRSMAGWGAGMAYTAAVLAGCAVAKPPTTLTGPAITNAEDRALARNVVLAWSILDRLDPVARAEAGAVGEAPWPPVAAQRREGVTARLAPVQRQLRAIADEALSPPWQSAKQLLQRRMSAAAPVWDGYTTQALVGRGLWASLGPEAWPAVQSTAPLEGLGYFLNAVRTATVPTGRDRLQAALAQLDRQREWLRGLTSSRPSFDAQRALAVAALDVHEQALQSARRTATARPAPARRPWTDHWVEAPSAGDIEAAAERWVDRLQFDLLALASSTSTATSPRARGEALANAQPPDAGPDTLDAFLGRLANIVQPSCPAPPTLTATTAPANLRGLAAVRLDARRAQTTTTTYRLFVSVDGDAARDLYPPAKVMALALYEGWPGRALYRWATRTRPDRGLTEQRWPDPVLAQGWPLFALARLVAPADTPPAVRWHVGQLLLRAAVDAQVDLRIQRAEPADDDALIDWLTTVGGQSEAEARRKLDIARIEPGRLTAPFLGWWTLSRLADALLPTPDTIQVRRFAACAELPPDLLPTCMRPED